MIDDQMMMRFSLFATEQKSCIYIYKIAMIFLVQIDIEGWPWFPLRLAKHRFLVRVSWYPQLPFRIVL